MDPALSPLGSFIGKLLGDVFVNSRKRRMSIEELRGRVQEMAISNEQFRVTAQVNEHRIAFLESFISALVVSGYFYREAGYIRVISDVSRPQIGQVIQGAVETVDTQSLREAEVSVTGPTVSSSGKADESDAATIFLGGFLEELRVKRHSAGA